MKKYLDDEVLSSMNNAKRRELCINDIGVNDFLVSMSHNKPKSPQLIKNLKAYANLLCRYLLPLMEKNQWKSTTEVFVIENVKILYEHLLAIGKIRQFYEDTDSFIMEIQNEVVIFNGQI